jgi:plastocyanin
MPTLDYWIQLENKPWDVTPHNIDRLTGQTIEQLTTTLGGTPKAPAVRTLTSPVTAATRSTTMYWPVDDALILRRYTADWAAPDDRKVNPWDVNEPDPTDNGTMGTIPGVVIECNVGDTVIVHFRNRDMRTNPDGTLKHVHERAHSLHPHGFVFENRYDGAYPLSPPDPTQPVGTEAPLWTMLGVADLKKGDRIPAPDPSAPAIPHGGTFTYTWNTFGWPTTAGVWHYHDHSICDMENIMLGAIGIIVIHNPDDPDDVLVQDLPGGLPNGSPVEKKCFPFPFPVPTLPHDVNKFLTAHPPKGFEMSPEVGGGGEGGRATRKVSAKKPETEVKATDVTPLTIDRDFASLELAEDLRAVRQICIRRYREPPQKALYLQLYHEMPGAQMLINGRKYLGNGPTVVAGPKTRMRFGVVGMNMMAFHTFHLHGHRWVIPGPEGNKPGGGDGPGAIQNSPLIKAASQFEDTKIFGPANSFSFTINQGTFMGAPVGAALGEWHMHCHVLGHMMSDFMGGMMGSLLIIQGGELALGLPSGEPCHMPMPPGPGVPMTASVRSTDNCTWRDDATGTPETTIKVGGTVTWWDAGGLCPNHTVVSDNMPPFDTLSPPLASPLLPTPPAPGFSHTFTTVGNFGYHCGVHSGNPVTKTGMWGIVHVVP